MREKFSVKKAVRAAAAALALALVFSGCAKPGINTDPEYLIEEGQLEYVSEKDFKLADELKEALGTAVYKYKKAPRVLIYHTHATEAYRMEGDYTYVPTEDYRTDDNTKNVVYAGTVLADELEKLGFEVIHDTTNVEPPELISAYSRSLEVMESYDDIDIYIDLHRNAADAEKKKDDVAVIDGKRCARLFFVVGTGVGTYEGEYDVKPDWAKNYVASASVTDKLRQVDPELAKDVLVKVGRHNQHLDGICLLAEVGHNANTLDDVLNTLPYLAKAMSEVFVF